VITDFVVLDGDIVDKDHNIAIKTLNNVKLILIVILIIVVQSKKCVKNAKIHNANIIQIVIMANVAQLKENVVFYIK
jgi:hypothetical protein